MDRAWVRELRDKCRAAGVPFYFKQANGLYPGTGDRLDGKFYHESPPLRASPPVGLFTP